MTMKSSSNACLELKAVEIGLGEEVLFSISQKILPGEVLSVMGPSGSGKSTLLAYIGGFLDPAFTSRGSVFLNGIEISEKPAEQRRVGILFQDPLLFPHMSVGGNLLFAMGPQVKGMHNRRELANQALEEAGLGETFDRDPATLSGGQKARVALMRVLLAQPQALLLDEPFSKLDSDRRARVREFVLAEAARRRLPVLLVSHDMADAEAAGGKILDLRPPEHC